MHEKSKRVFVCEASEVDGSKQASNRARTGSRVGERGGARGRHDGVIEQEQAVRVGSNHLIRITIKAQGSARNGLGSAIPQPGMAD